MIDDATKEIVSKFISEKSLEIVRIHNSRSKTEDVLKKYAMDIIQRIIRELEKNSKYIRIQIQNKDREYDNFVFSEINKVMKNIGYKGSVSYDNEGLGYATLQFVFKYNL